MNMNKREKILAIATGAVLALIAIGYGYMQVSSGINIRRAAVDKLKQDIAEKERRLRVAQRAARRLSIYREMSLPEDDELSKSLYKSWLLDKLVDVGMLKNNINAQGRGRSKTAHEHTFTVTSEGNLEQFTKLLYEFYSANHLHRLRTLRVQPVKGKKELTVALTIDALSLQKADHNDRLNEEPSERLQHKDQEKYLQVILGRNLFSPANNIPKFSSSSTQRGKPNSLLSFDVSAKDPDVLDQVSYAFEGDPLAGAKLDPKSGKFSWTPKEKGEYQVTVVASDDGYPAKKERQVIKLVIADPPPPEKPKKTLEFDNAKYTKVSGFLAVDGRWEVWLNNRTKGEILKLHVGDKVDIGSIQGVVKNIRSNSVEFDMDGKSLVLSLDDSLIGNGKSTTNE